MPLTVKLKIVILGKPTESFLYARRNWSPRKTEQVERPHFSSDYPFSRDYPFPKEIAKVAFAMQQSKPVRSNWLGQRRLLAHIASFRCSATIRRLSGHTGLWRFVNRAD